MARLPLASWRLKNSTCRKRFFASSNVRYGPPRLLPWLETTRYPLLCFLIISPLLYAFSLPAGRYQRAVEL
jgi:hypothetical protein